MSEQVYTAQTFAEHIKSAHLAAIAAIQTLPAKAPKPRRGDIVALVDESGEVWGTGIVARKPGNLTLIRWDNSNRTEIRNTGNLVKVGAGVWSVS